MMTEADTGQLDVGIVRLADPRPHHLNPGDVAIGVVARAGDEPGIALVQILRQLPIENRPDPKFQFGARAAKPLINISE